MARAKVTSRTLDLELKIMRMSRQVMRLIERDELRKSRRPKDAPAPWLAAGLALNALVDEWERSRRWLG